MKGERPSNERKHPGGPNLRTNGCIAGCCSTRSTQSSKLDIQARKSVAGARKIVTHQYLRLNSSYTPDNNPHNRDCVRLRLATHVLLLLFPSLRLVDGVLIGVGLYGGVNISRMKLRKTRTSHLHDPRPVYDRSFFCTNIQQC